ncbi:DegT/DnrJ/EryC1/StrS family aminotransferase [Caldovatus aquaticus]|uniref:DegT/DnrJ/EryC1/StrS aminotransferase family protein n=1 Tax=Caldovatus aquaticus TaxID=2865671 RepID=A0ABS7F4A6_9PROT|nr:DegT/DnrJ/EryC1/StrS aminotransferase family protein [Caldovatus aquaticus]MBW8270453.1 DegT/DnrJ/EryC1/StrS aminotransferase family protein [Caldovatus aquaticus]
MTDSGPIALFDIQAQQARIRAELERRIAAVLDHGRYIAGPEVEELEARLAAFCGEGVHCVGVSSGTDALQIALMAEGIGRGDAVFLPAFTYTATAEVALVLGATPVFVDVEETSFNLDPADLERRIALVRAEGRLRPRAVIGVDLFGLPADWPAILALCRREGMFALDDAAQAFGAALDGVRLGAWGDATALSFYPTKTLGCYGDGGALLTRDAARAALYRSLRTHGEGKTRYEVLRIGMNGRLDTLQAAVLLAKLPLFEEELAARARIGALYDARLAGSGIGIQETRQARAVHARGLYTVRFPDQAARERAMAALQAQGIAAGIYYPRPLHRQPAYAEAHRTAIRGEAPPLVVSESLASRVLSLPMHPYLGEAEVERVCSVLLGAARG